MTGGKQLVMNLIKSKKVVMISKAEFGFFFYFGYESESRIERG
jgi:hypothetical protein